MAARQTHFRNCATVTSAPSAMLRDVLIRHLHRHAVRAIHQMQRARNAMRHLSLRVRHRAEPEVHHGIAVTRARRSEREALMALLGEIEDTIFAILLSSE
jgi:hypothetical protein